MNLINGISEIIDNYDYYIFDIWGVIHDGSSLYPGVLETLSYIKKNNKNISFLSNAPRRSLKVEAILNKFGISADIYDFVLTSGECAYEDFLINQNKNFSKFGKKYLYIGPDRDADLLNNLDYQRVNNPCDADFVLVTGFDNDDSKLSEKLPLAIQANDFKIPMVCVNPDLIVVKQDGKELLCAGALALEYQKIGGVVNYYGKPFSRVYQMTLENFLSTTKNEITKSKIIAIGDGIETDIKGACNYQIDSVLVSGGILTRELGISFWQNPELDKINKICNNYKTFPNYIISNLKI